MAATEMASFAARNFTVGRPDKPRSLPRVKFVACDRVLIGLALLWQILRGAGFTNHFFYDSWVVGFWRGRPWLAGHWTGRRSLDAFSSRLWIGWVTRRGDGCVRSTSRD